MPAAPRWRVLWWTAPIAVAAHAVIFWGPGLIDKEGVSFITAYLGQRSWLPLIFDPAVNDFGAYQGRELSYVGDYLNARVFAWLFAHGWLVLIPAVNVISLAAILVGTAIVLHRSWRFDPATTALVLAWFLSVIVVQASVGIYYRSAKMLLLALLLALLFQAVALLANQAATVSRRRLALLFATGLLMPLVDRQGLFYLAWFVAVAAVWSVSTRRASRPLAWRLASVLVVTLAAAVAGELYNRAVGPWVIYQVNGYWPDFSFQELDIRAAVADSRFWRAGRVMLALQADFFFGAWGLPLAALAGIAFWARQLLARSASGWRAVAAVAARDLLVGVTASFGLLLLAALMIQRHPYVLTSPDHPYWYFFLPMHGVFFFGVALALRHLALAGTWRWHRGLLIAMALCIVGNGMRWRDQRHVMLGSGYFISEYEKSQHILDGHARIRSAPGGDPDGIERFVSLGDFGGVMRVPPPRLQFFPDTMNLALSVRAGRAPLAAAGGFHWQAVRDFVSSDGSPLFEADQVSLTLAALRAAGIVELRVSPARFPRPDIGPVVVDAIRGARSHVLRERVQGDVTSFALAPVAFAGGTIASQPAALVRVPDDELTLTASVGQGDLAAVLDRNPATRWTSGGPQRGDEWIRVAFRHPRDVARIRIELIRRTYTDYPRGIVIEGEHDGQRVPLFSGSLLTPLVRGLLREPFRAPAEIDFAPNICDAIVIRQTGTTRVWYWSVHELSVWTR